MRRSQVFVVVVALLTGGCGSLSAPPRDHFYRLAVAPPAAESRPAAGITVHVPPFAASGLHSERAIVYAHGDGTSLEQYPYHFWVDSPRMLLQGALADYLEQVNGTVVTLAPSREAQRVVRGRILNFERGEVDGEPAALVALKIEVFDAASGSRSGGGRYARSVKLGDDSVAELVSALNAATRDVFAAFTRDLEAPSG